MVPNANQQTAGKKKKRGEGRRVKRGREEGKDRKKRGGEKILSHHLEGQPHLSAKAKNRL